jgi:YebC/PmpR family DNA-binding regulatory protein
MSGHSKWSQIKHKKGAADAKKGIAFGKLARAISVAARGNPDPTKNLRLKAEIDRARAVNMPNDSIQRAIQRVTDKASAALNEVQLEFIGTGGAAIIVSAITDNSNRTINELKQLATKPGARMVGQGSLLWMFQKSSEGLVATVPAPIPNQDDQQKLEAFLNAIDDHDDVQEVFTNAEY